MSPSCYSHVTFNVTFIFKVNAGQRLESHHVTAFIIKEVLILYYYQHSNLMLLQHLPFIMHGNDSNMESNM